MTLNEAAEAGIDLSVLRVIIPRLWQPNKHVEPKLGLEIIDGPYKGVIFAFTKFTTMAVKLDNGMIPARFETTVFQSPKGFTPDEAWDDFTTEVLMAWIAYIQHQDYRDLSKAIPQTTSIH